MKNIFIFILLLFYCLPSFSQNTITLKGKVIKENSQLPLEAATVYFMTEKDSTVIDYTISDKNGFFLV